MTSQDAEALFERICEAFAGVPKDGQVKYYLQRLERASLMQVKDVFEWLLDHCNSRFFPSLSEIADAINATRKPEYASSGEPLQRNRPWHTTEEARLAIEAQERVIAMSDEEYEQALDDYRRRREAGVPLRAIQGGRRE